MLTKTQRLARQADLTLVLRKGRKTELIPLRLYARPNSKQLNRFGFLLKERVLPNAVSRNRWKRIMREIIKRNHKRLQPGQDLVFVLAQKPLPPLNQLNFAAWENQVHALLEAAGMLKNHV